MTPKASRTSHVVSRVWSVTAAFSLIEVVLAVAVFATAIVAVIGLMGPMTQRVNDVIDSEVAARLASSIQVELERVGFSSAKDLMGGVGGTTDIELVANSRGDLVRLLTPVGGVVTADNNLDHPTVPGIAERDRYFHVTLTHQVPFTVNSGSLALRADVVWPYRIPTGPATTTVAVSGDGSVLANSGELRTLTYFFALQP